MHPKVCIESILIFKFSSYPYIFTIFRYDAIGLGWVFHLTTIPVIGAVADALYDLWAENRLRLTGRPDLAETLKQRAKDVNLMSGSEVMGVECDSDACGIEYDD